MSEAKLLYLLKKKKGFFEAVLELSETEADVPLHEWLSILEQKKILLSCIEEIDAEIQHFKESFQILPHEVCEEIEAIRKVIQHILHLDTLNQEKRKQGLFNSLGGIAPKQTGADDLQSAET